MRVEASYLRRLLGIVLLTSVAAYAQLGGVDSFAEAFDHFGGALASGDFNGDGYEDLGGWPALGRRNRRVCRRH
jgi:hypothetical protein